MSEIVIPDKSPRDNYFATEWNTVKAAINDNNDRVSNLEGTQGNIIADISDLPPPIGGVITLSIANQTYSFTGVVDLGVNRIEIAADGIKLRGANAETDCVTSTTGAALISAANYGVSMSNLKLEGPSASHLIDITGSGSETFSAMQCIFIQGNIGVSLNGIGTFSINTCPFVANNTGVLLGGTMKQGTIRVCPFESNATSGIDLNGATMTAVDISSNTFDMLATTTAIVLASSGANINAGGLGTIFGNKAFGDPSATAISGYTSFEPEWEVLANTSNIIISDRLEPQGFGAYFDDASSTQTFDAIASKLEINGLGSGTYTDKLPLSIRGTGELWDTVDNKITPVTLDDTFSVRVNLTVTATTSNPTRFDLIIDIGGGTTPSIPVVIEGKTLKTGSFPQNYVINSPVYDRATFLANGGQIFIVVDSGTMTVEVRSISFFRNGSGAS